MLFDLYSSSFELQFAKLCFSDYLCTVKSTFNILVAVQVITSYKWQKYEIISNDWILYLIRNFLYKNKRIEKFWLSHLKFSACMSFVHCASKMVSRQELRAINLISKKLYSCALRKRLVWLFCILTFL